LGIARRLYEDVEELQYATGISRRFIHAVGILLNIARASHGGCIPSSKAVTVTD
jgi:hypothetical protein